ncbi:MAG: hypothetical protein WBI05_02835 [Rhodoferax sp.]|jgi:hypothetical protein|uniref:hypothetical protein n=1 Tax=Rhodoferax sp. TaxID=50421 RepID=UPI003BB4EDAF
MPDTLERVVGPKPTLNRLYLERLLLNPQMKTRLLQIGGAGATSQCSRRVCNTTFNGAENEKQP